MDGIFFRISGSCYFFLLMARIRTGNKTKLVMVPTTSVSDVSHPNALVPPNPLKQKIMKPAMSTRDVYIMLMPVCLMVSMRVV
jgi:hypothetical protein